MKLLLSYDYFRLEGLLLSINIAAVLQIYFYCLFIITNCHNPRSESTLLTYDDLQFRILPLNLNPMETAAPRHEGLQCTAGLPEPKTHCIAFPG